MTREEAARELTIAYQRQREADERALETRSQSASAGGAHAAHKA